MQPAAIDEIIEHANRTANRLLHCLVSKLVKVQDKYDYYNADNDITDLGISTPVRMRHIRPGIGWASRAVNTLSDRVAFDGFANDKFSINTYLDEIGGTTVLSKAKHDAFIAGCSFIAISDDGNGGKVLVPFTALEATGEVDQTTGLLKCGLAVTKWHMPKRQQPGLGYAPKDYILFTPEYTAVYENMSLVQITPNPTGRTMLHPITHRSSADRPLGKSRLTNTARRIINEVGRLKRREELAEEFYALPQRYISGLAEGAEKDANLDSAIGKVWAINVDEDGNHPDIGQLAQMSIDGFETSKKDKARDFCAETALTLRNLGYESGNPSSAESLAAMSDDLLLEAKNSQAEMGKQFKEIVISLRLALDNNNEIPAGLRDIIPAWQPIFQADIGQVGDAMYKLFQAMPELVGTVEGYQMMGIGIRQAEQLVQRRLQNNSASFMSGSNGGTK
jgi:hypothetical protein